MREIITPDPEPRNTPFHKRIVSIEPIPGTRSGHFVDLECGHTCMTFGSLSHAKGVVLCDLCKREAGGQNA